MKKHLAKVLLALSIALTTALSASAKSWPIAFNCEPEDAAVYINGSKMSDTTPVVLDIDQKVATKIMMVQFRKEGFKSKTVTITFDKKQLKANPVVYAKLTRDPNASSSREKTLNEQQMTERVDRHSAGKTSMEETILRWYFDSDPRGARIYYRVISNAPAEVKNTNETYLTTTPLEETKSLNIQGLTYDNSRNVTIEIKVSKRGYEDQVKRFNVRQALDQQEISGFFELVPKEEPKPAKKTGEEE